MVQTGEVATLVGLVGLGLAVKLFKLKNWCTPEVQAEEKVDDAYDEEVVAWPGVSSALVRAMKRAVDHGARPVPYTTQVTIETELLQDIAKAVVHRIQAAAPPGALDIMLTTIRSCDAYADKKGSRNVALTFMAYDRRSNTSIEIYAEVSLRYTGELYLLDARPATPGIKIPKKCQNVRPVNSKVYAPYTPVVSPII